MKKVLIALGISTFLVTTGFSKELLLKTIKISGAPTDARVFGNKIYIATEMGKIDIVDIKTKKKIRSIVFPKFQDFMGEYQPPKVFSVDVSPDGKTIVAAVQGNRGGRELYIYKNGKLKKLIDWSKNIPVYRVRFVTNNRVILGLSGDEVILYDIRKNKPIYRKYIGMSFFSDMEINEKRDKIALTDESGDTRIFDIKKAKVVKIIEELNRDKSFDVDFRNNKIMNGSRDKRAVFYNLKTGKYKILPAKDFMVFSVGLSPSGKRGAYLYDDKYNVRVVNTFSGDTIAILKGHTATPSVIKFINEKELITGCDDGKVFFWKIRK